MMHYKKCSQAGQDRFAYELVGDQGTYVEIGAFRPASKSNTYNLEVGGGWKGFSIELDISHQPAWAECYERKNKVYWDNALTFDYAAAIIENNLPMHINYLSCDIEPPSNTFDALKRVINSGITFDCITFEHDAYQNHSGIDYNKLATEFLIEHGYKVAVTDVYAKSPHKIFETWYVKDNIDFQEISYTDWMLHKQ